MVLRSWFFVVGSWFLVVGSWFLVVGSWFLVLRSLFFGQPKKMVEAEFAGAFDGHRVGAAEGVAVVFDQPEVEFFAEGENSTEIERVAEGVGHHDGFGFSEGEGGFELRAVGISCLGVGIYENRDCTDLDDGGYGGRKPCGDGNDFIAWADALVFREFVSCEC